MHKNRERRRKKKEREKNVHGIPIKKSTIREKERKEKEEEETREGKKKEDNRQKLCVYISLLPLVYDIPLSLTIEQQYQISSLATFLGNQVSISFFYLYMIIYTVTKHFIVAESFSQIN
jgi:H+/gluconate symporter-like permease